MNNKLAIVQMTSTHVLQENLSKTDELILQAVDQGAELIILPENFAMMDKPGTKYHETVGDGTVQSFLSATAKKNQCWLVGGTVPLIDDRRDKPQSACLVFNDHGQCVARYNKIHLFDVNVPGRSETYFESEFLAPGDEVVVLQTPVGKLGLSICYDVRFPEFFRALVSKGAEIIALPASFTVPTGKAHWEILLRARAIENQVYLAAAAETGEHTNNKKTYGHSMIVGPWGDVKASLESQEGTLTIEVDLASLHQLREEFPVLKHRRVFFKDNQS